MRRCFPIVIAALALLPRPFVGQEAQALRVFLDCQRMFCDFDHLRREIGFVNWVRDRQVAEIHILGTSEGTGGGGRQFTLALIGRQRFTGTVDTLGFVTNATDTDAEVRDALTRTLTLGLVRFVAGTPLANRIRVAYDAPATADQQIGPTDDPWNFWVFSIRVGGSVDGESLERSTSGNGRIGASRVTEGWKLRFSVRGRYSRDVFEPEDPTQDTSETFITSSYGADVESVWSLGPHWSVGFISEISGSTFSNEDFAFEGGPAIEYSVFPYAESTRRRFTFLYAIGANYFDFEEVTLFGKTTDWLPIHVLDINLEYQQPWGSMFVELEGSQFLDDLAKHSVELGGGVNLRVFRGLSLNLFASVERVKDQINLPAGGLTPEEILREQGERGTEFRYRTSISFSYTFGSIFNNIVNPRF